MSDKLEGLEPNKPLQEAGVIDNLSMWLRDDKSKEGHKIEMARLILSGVVRRLRGEDTRGYGIVSPASEGIDHIPRHRGIPTVRRRHQTP